MKKFFLFSTLISCTLFAACSKQEGEIHLIPSNHDQSADNTGNHDCDNKTKTLTADFTINNDKSRVSESEELLLTNKSVNAVFYEWDFGNGDKSTAVLPSYRYKIHGFYTVTLKTTDALGNTRQASRDVEVLCVFVGGSHEDE